MTSKIIRIPGSRTQKKPVRMIASVDVLNCPRRQKVFQNLEVLSLRYRLLIPSKTGSKDITFDSRFSSAKKLTRLREEGFRIKYGLGTHMNSRVREKESEALFLCISVEKVQQIVDHYCRETTPQRFNKTYRRYPESVKQMSKTFVRIAHGSDWRSYQNAAKLSDCDPGFCDSGVPPSWNEIWREFHEFAKETPQYQQKNLELVDELKNSLELGHPIVTVIGDFAVAAFNEACEMHVKKGEPNNLHDFEVMECKYVKNTNAFQFYMIIEAVEEGILGVYETQVLCHDDGTRSLTKFILTDRNPTGTKAMAISLFSWVMSFCGTLPCDTRKKENKLGKIFDETIGPDRGTAWALLDLLENALDRTIKELHKVLSLGLRLVFSKNCNQITNSDDWSHPDNHYISGMVLRTKATPCSGYDYVNPVDLGR